MTPACSGGLSRLPPDQLDDRIACRQVGLGAQSRLIHRAGAQAQHLRVERALGVHDRCIDHEMIEPVEAPATAGRRGSLCGPAESGCPPRRCAPRTAPSSSRDRRIAASAGGVRWRPGGWSEGSPVQTRPRSASRRWSAIASTTGSAKWPIQHRLSSMEVMILPVAGSRAGCMVGSWCSSRSDGPTLSAQAGKPCESTPAAISGRPRMSIYVARLIDRSRTRSTTWLIPVIILFTFPVSLIGAQQDRGDSGNLPSG